MVNRNMSREELEVALNKMFCNYMQGEYNDVETFFEIGMNYIEEYSNVDYDTAIEIVDNVISGK